MKTLKDYNPRYLAKLEEYREKGESAPGAMAFLDCCRYVSKNHEAVEKEREGWTKEDRLEHTRLLEESFTDADLRRLSVAGLHQIQRWHYGEVLKKRLASRETH